MRIVTRVFVRVVCMVALAILLYLTVALPGLLARDPCELHKLPSYGELKGCRHVERL